MMLQKMIQNRPRFFQIALENVKVVMEELQREDIPRIQSRIAEIRDLQSNETFRAERKLIRQEASEIRYIV